MVSGFFGWHLLTIFAVVALIGIALWVAVWILRRASRAVGAERNTDQRTGE